MLDSIYAASHDIQAIPAAPDYALNFVIGGPAVGLLRADLLGVLESYMPDTFRLGRLQISTIGLCKTLHTVHDIARLRLRGSMRSTRNACGECGRFSYLPVPPLYILACDLPDVQIRQANGARFVAGSRVADAIRARRQQFKALDVDELAVREQPLDGLPTTLPLTWEEYEHYERSQGRRAVLGKETWLPNPRLKLTLGSWDRAQIEKYGMEARFERPDPWKTAVMIETCGDDQERAEALDTLKDWPREFQEEVLRLLPRARRALA